jgi:multiple sugar transport system ATP-binding protein
MPEMLAGASGALVLGVRPENVHLDDAAAYRGRIVAVEYLGTTQIVTLDTACGVVKARMASDHVVKPGDLVGLRFDERTLTLFDGSGRALLSKANQRVLTHG